MVFRVAQCWILCLLLAARVACGQSPTVPNRGGCQAGAKSIADARTSQAQNPEALGPRLKLADALTDQACYEEAALVLEAAQLVYPHNSEIGGKLRAVRSLVTEQSYIQDMTQAQEKAQLQRDRLRCTRLADLGACQAALKISPNDAQLLAAQGDALLQAGRRTEAVASYQLAQQHGAEDPALRSKLALLVASENVEKARASQVDAELVTDHQRPIHVVEEEAPLRAKSTVRSRAHREKALAVATQGSPAPLPSPPPLVFSNEAAPGLSH
ncbi:MAG: hypothetical protein JOY91_08185 [Sinobacteraceae bacterium]|nr:hypothetical protein [Nevskiaceae bacterium]